MSATIRYFFHTFGCRVNQYETESLREKLLGGVGAERPSFNSADRSGERDATFTQTPFFEDADVCIVNTCTVTREADKDALRLIRRISKRNPSARLVVTGCLASRDPEEILASAPGAWVVGNDRKGLIPAMLGCAAIGDFHGISELHNHSRAFVKVQDGCNMHCAYCIIPSVRPQLSCKPYGALEREARRLIESGTQEIVLCGVRLGRYIAQDDSGRRIDFVGMLDRLMSLPGDFRVRLSSFEVTDLTDRFLDATLKWGDGFCPSFHVPLQSGSEATLKRMQRWYSADFYRRRIEALRSRWPDAGLFSDVMAGFPGETEDHFKESFDFIERMGFSGLHVFRYSNRPGTPAARYQDVVPEETVIGRAEAMRGLDRRLREAFAARAVGKVCRILVESRKRSPQPPFHEEPPEGMTEHFLRARFDRDPGPGLVWARLVSTEGPVALGTVMIERERNFKYNSLLELS